MGRRPTNRERKPAELSPEQMRAALPKLRRRLAELDEIDVSTIEDRSDPRLDSLEQKIDATLVPIFGADTVDYSRYRVILDNAPLNMLYGTPINEVREGYRKGIEQARSNIQTIIELFEENIGDIGGSSEGRARRAYGEIDIHPEVRRATERLFDDGHYSNAVEDACKVLDGLVKLRSGKSETSGTDLMQQVFSPKNPILKFNDQLTESERSEQQGMMFLYAGAMLAFRNPRAHEIVEDDPEKALEYIGFISLLAKSLDKAERT